MPLVVTPGASYTWATASWSWDDVRAGKTWDDAYPAVYTETEAESLSVVEARTSAATMPRSEAVALSESRAALAAKIRSESIAAADAQQDIVAYVRSTIEALAASDAATAQILKTFGELIAPADASVNVAAFNRNTNEPVSIAETYVDLIGFINSVSESVLVTEALLRASSKRVAESFGVNESTVREISKGIAEAIAAAESYVGLIGFLNAITESVGISESRRAIMAKLSAESVAALDQLVRRVNAVISDLAIMSSGMTQQEFADRIAFRKPLGNYPPKPMQPGDYRYERAIIGILLQDVARTTRVVSLDTAKLTVDVPDVTDRGSVVLTSSGATVTFTRSFYDAPEIQVIQTAGSTRAIPSVNTITASSFFVQLFDAASPTTPVAGTISWTALGK